jgi:hypothetical protein
MARASEISSKELDELHAFVLELWRGLYGDSIEGAPLGFVYTDTGPFGQLVFDKIGVQPFDKELFALAEPGEEEARFKELFDAATEANTQRQRAAAALGNSAAAAGALDADRAAAISRALATADAAMSATAAIMSETAATLANARATMDAVDAIASAMRASVIVSLVPVERVSTKRPAESAHSGNPAGQRAQHSLALQGVGASAAPATVRRSTRRRTQQSAMGLVGATATGALATVLRFLSSADVISIAWTCRQLWHFARGRSNPPRDVFAAHQPDLRLVGPRTVVATARTADMWLFSDAVGIASDDASLHAIALKLGVLIELKIRDPPGGARTPADRRFCVDYIGDSIYRYVRAARAWRSVALLLPCAIARP